MRNLNVDEIDASENEPKKDSKEDFDEDLEEKPKDDPEENIASHHSPK